MSLLHSRSKQLTYEVHAQYKQANGGIQYNTSDKKWLLWKKKQGQYIHQSERSQLIW